MSDVAIGLQRLRLLTHLELDFCHNDVDDRGCFLLARSLPASLLVFSLICSESPVTNAGIWEITRALPPSLLSLELDFRNPELWAQLLSFSLSRTL